MSRQAGSVELTEVTVLDLVHGDTELEQRLLEVNRSGHDPPILFRWLDDNLTTFWIKAVAYSAVEDAHAPPSQINEGEHLTGEPNLMDLKAWILELLSNGSERGLVVAVGGSGIPVGLNCTLLQNNEAQHILARLDVVVPWFRGVIEHGHALPGPLATLFCLREDNSGKCDAQTCDSILWT
jgi:hypothetical protein